MRASRVFNITGIRIEFHIWRFRVGIPTAVAFLTLSMAMVALALVSLWASLALLVPTLIILGTLQWIISKADPDHVMSETTTIRLMVTSLWNRGRVTSRSWK